MSVLRDYWGTFNPLPLEELPPPMLNENRPLFNLPNLEPKGPTSGPVETPTPAGVEGAGGAAGALI